MKTADKKKIESIVRRLLAESASFAGEYFDRQDRGLDKADEYAEPAVLALELVFKGMGMTYDAQAGHLTVPEQHSSEEWTELFNKIPGYDVKAHPGLGRSKDEPAETWIGWKDGYIRFDAHLRSQRPDLPGGLGIRV